MGLGLLVAIHSPKVCAEEPNSAGFVYVMTNQNPGNSVIQYRRTSNGSLTWQREVATGGNGSGATKVDPLGSQDSLVLSGDGQLLLAVNAGSNEVSVLGLKNKALTWLSKTNSGGVFPNSLALDKDLVYVLNAQATPHISGFRLNVDGTLTAIPNSSVNVPGGAAAAPNDIRFSPDGSQLLLTESATNQIDIFPIGDNGVAGSPVSQASAGGSPFGIRFGHRGVVVISEAAGSASSYQLGDLTLTVISGAVVNTQKASCWISLTRSGRYAYLSNTGSGTLSSYVVGPDGQLTLAKAIAGSEAGSAPIDSALSRDSRFLYVDDSARGGVLLFRVDGASLIPIGNISSLPTSIQGIAAQ